LFHAASLFSEVVGRSRTNGTPIEDGWFRVQLIEIMEGKGFISLLITNENDDPPQLVLKDVVGTNLVWKG